MREQLPRVPSFPHPLRRLFAGRPAIMGPVLRTVDRVIAGHLIKKAGFIPRTTGTDAVTLMMCLDARDWSSASAFATISCPSRENAPGVAKPGSASR
jgi:hypothetical protein